MHSLGYYCISITFLVEQSMLWIMIYVKSTCETCCDSAFCQYLVVNWFRLYKSECLNIIITFTLTNICNQTWNSNYASISISVVCIGTAELRPTAGKAFYFADRSTELRSLSQVIFHDRVKKRRWVETLTPFSSDKFHLTFTINY